MRRASQSLAHTRPSAPVIVLVEDEQLPESLRVVELQPAGIQSTGIQPVGAVPTVLGPDMLLDTDREALARARHQAYVRNERMMGRFDPGTRSLAPWDKLPESIKESNRRFADSVASKIRQLNHRIVPLDPDRYGLTELELSSELIEELAEAEHERWARDLKADGWASTDGSNDPDRKLHPLLVSWEVLPDEEKQKDRASITELPTMLEAAGYMILPADEAGASGCRHLNYVCEQRETDD